MRLIKTIITLLRNNFDKTIKIYFYLNNIYMTLTKYHKYKRFRQMRNKSRRGGLSGDVSITLDNLEEHELLFETMLLERILVEKYPHADKDTLNDIFNPLNPFGKQILEDGAELTEQWLPVLRTQLERESNDPPRMYTSYKEALSNLLNRALHYTRKVNDHPAGAHDMPIVSKRVLGKSPYTPEPGQASAGEYTAHTGEDGRTYYHNAKTGNSTYDPPMYNAYKSDNGKLYYHNALLDHTTWELPQSASVLVAAANQSGGSVKRRRGKKGKTLRKKKSHRR